jgi:F-type H+-transporting ATPase subunit a
VSESLQRQLPFIVVLNFAIAAALLMVLARYVMAKPLALRPGARQNAGEFVLDWFVDLARRVHPRQVGLIAPFLATLFLLILLSNLLALIPLPLLRIPPASFYSVPLALALVAVVGVPVLVARINGPRAALRHSFWPNPLHLVGQVSDTLSLSLRLYGNIGGEYVVAILAAQAAPYGIPLIIHTLGLIPAVVQPIVFTLLTASFLTTSITVETGERRSAR